MNGEMIELKATLTISPDELREVLQRAAAGMRLDQGAGKAKEPVKKKGAPKPKPAPEPEEPEENIRLKINPDDVIEDQVKSVIIQSAAHRHGDAIARKIFQSWGDEDTKAVTICRQIFPGTTLETIAKAVVDTTESELMALPRLFMSGLFQKAADLAPNAQKIAIPKAKACSICEGVSVHKAGCPIGVKEAMEREAQEDGGAMPARVKNAEPKEAPPEPCNMGGREGGCPIPEHGILFQGGAHIPVHSAETMKKLRDAMSGSPVASQWSAPQPPEKPKRERPKKEK